MDSLKTQTVVVNGTAKVAFNERAASATGSLTTHQLNTIQIEPQVQDKKNITTQIKERLSEVKEIVKNPRHVKKINPFYSYFPSFYVKEIRNAFAVFLCWVIVFVVSLGLIGWAIAEIVLDKELSNWIMLLFIPPFALVMSMLIVYINKYYGFRSEAKSINFKDEKTLSIHVQRLYRRLKTGYINVNWMCFTTYVSGGLVILINFAVAWAAWNFKVNFGTWDPAAYGGQYIYAIIFFSSIAAILFALVMHVSLLLTNYIRYSRIENFYNFMIVPQEELNAIKKQKNRRDLIIFLVIAGMIGFIGYVIYRVVKRTRTTNVVVKT